jgi:hypothetical protein
METERYLADDRFFDLVAIGDLAGAASLEELAGQRRGAPPYPTEMVRQAEEAWRTPLADLTCEQVRLLVSQKMGLEWLGRAASALARLQPGATITNYPGEMALLCLRAADLLSNLAQPEFGRWLAGDFGWMDDVYGWSRPLLREATAALAEARTR